MPVTLRSTWSLMSAYSGHSETSSGRSLERGLRQVFQPPEIVPPGVREVLVERHDARVLGSGHHPPTAFPEHRKADLAHDLVVDVVADAKREVHLLRLQAVDLPTEEIDRHRVVVSRRGQQLGVAHVAAVDRIGQVQVDHRRLGEEGEPLVLQASGGSQVAGVLGVEEFLGDHRALVRLVVHERLPGDRLVVDVRPAIPRRTLPEASGGSVGVALRGLEAVRGRRPGRQQRGVAVDRVVVARCWPG